MTHGKSKNFETIRCWPADGDHVKFFPLKGGASGSTALCIAYNLGHDFYSCSMQERTQRVKELLELIPRVLREVTREMVDEARMKVQ